MRRALFVGGLGMISMRALRTFRGRADEGALGKVRMGREFRAGTPRRADDLERAGLAIRISPQDQPLVPLVNEASLRGPLSMAGGETGAGKPLLSSPAGQAPGKSTSPVSETGPGSSASTNRGGSRRGRTRSTDATEHGGSNGDPVPSLLG